MIFAKNSDRPIFDCQPLRFVPRTSWPTNTMLQLEYLAIPQVPLTYTTLGAHPYWCWGAASSFQAGAAQPLGLLDI